MPLDLIVDTLDSVPEPLKAEYAKGDDGKFRLNVNGLEDTTGLKNALTTERKTAKEAKAQLDTWKKLGKAPEEITAMLEAQEAQRIELEKKAGNFDGLLKQHLEKANKESGEKITSLTTERDAALKSEREAIVDMRVTAALTKGKATAEGIELLKDRLGQRIKVESVEGKRTITVMGADGEPMAGSATGGVATIDDLVKEAIKNFPALFEGTGAGGGGTPPKQGYKGAKTISRSEWDKLNPWEQRAKISEGVKPVD